MPEFADWTRAVAMMGDSPVGWKAILLAEDGSMYALLQGEDAEGAQHTVRLDDEGRLSAFIIDSTDAWNRMLTIGNAELAARLGSSVIYDRRGQVMFAESFEQGWVRWAFNPGGDLADGEVTPTKAATGGYCVKLTGGNDLGRIAMINRLVPSRPIGRMGLEFSFCLPGEWDYIQGVLSFYTGTHIYTSRVKFHYTLGTLEVIDEFLGDTPVGIGEAFGATGFNTIKLVADVDTGKYVRLMFNNQEIDISARTILVGDDPASPPGIVVEIAILSIDEQNDVMYVDDIILTGGEP